MSAYIVAEDVTPYMQKPDEVIGSRLALLTSLCERASRVFDGAALKPPGYFGAAPGSAAAKVVYGSGTDMLKLPPLVEGTITSVTAPDGFQVPTYTVSNGYLLISPHPTRTWLASDLSSWREDVAYTVTARWGFDGVPADVKEATIELAVAMFRGSDPARVQRTGEGAQKAIINAIPPRVQMIAEFYAAENAVQVA